MLAARLERILRSRHSKLLIRVDGAGPTHGLLERLEVLSTTRRTVRYTVDWKITTEDEAAIAQFPESARETSLTQGGELQGGCQAAELTGVKPTTTHRSGSG
ncbi:hypothetical protein [Streptomyces sp. NPDC060065]|uniref:hypothetical protein n=1 Tax=Streptomyces sp. NPDC060065 TaxID=3347050 RepID=UPI00368C2638